MTQEDILRNPEEFDLSIETVGKGTLKSPMKGIQFVSEEDRIGLTTDVRRIQDFFIRTVKSMNFVNKENITDMTSFIQKTLYCIIIIVITYPNISF